MKDSPKISESVYWTTWHFVQEYININIHKNLISYIDGILSVVIEHCHNYKSILKSWQFICVQRYIH